MSEHPEVASLERAVTQSAREIRRLEKKLAEAQQEIARLTQALDEKDCETCWDDGRLAGMREAQAEIASLRVADPRVPASPSDREEP